MTNRSWDPKRQQLRALLKALRKEKSQLTQRQLSQRLGKPQSYVSKYEIGERKLDYVEITEICKALEIAMEEFNRLFEKRIKQL